MNYYLVAPNKVFRAGGDYLTYHSKSALADGTMVEIELGKQRAIGVVAKAVAKPNFKTKPIAGIINSMPLPEQIREAAEFLHSYYATELPVVWQTILPAGLRANTGGGNKAGDFRGSKSVVQPEPRSDPARNAAEEAAVLLPPLNINQKQALKEIRANKNKTVLLRGITGSGKTNICIHLLLEQLATGHSAILLVPEIALSAQLIQEVQRYIPQAILLHSGLTPAKRRALFAQILTAEQPQIIVGARSALFAPVQELGLVIIDECHDNSYHQDQNPKYSALRLASAIAPRTLLGSATPNVLDYYLAEQKQAVVHLTKKARAEVSMPKLRLIDLTDRDQLQQHRFFSDQLLAALRQNLDRGEQSLIFHNRRGSASLTLCRQCGWQALCAECSLPLTLHLDRRELRCHACGKRTAVQTACPVCGAAEIIHKGIGTKMIESELAKVFPEARLARFDSDVTASEAMSARYNSVKAGEIDIIIGTQSIAKGFDFPNLTLVGIVQADNGLILPDFAAEERAFQLLSQVVGRVGRNEKLSQILIQTYQPNHAMIRLGAAADFPAAAAELLAARQRSQFPPFAFLLKLTIAQKNEATAIRKTRELRSQLLQQFPQLEISQATPAFYERVAETYRWQLIVKSPRRNELLALIQTLPNEVRFELDPPSLL